MPSAFFRTPSLLLCLFAPLTFAAPAWESAPFRAVPKVMLADARALPVPEDAAIEVLLESTRVELDAQGRETRTRYVAYRVLTEDGARSCATVREWFSPWHEARPEVRARVITADGKVHTLDPKTL